MNLEKIQQLNSVNEIFEFIIKNSCNFSNTNKNLEIKNWENREYDCYLINNVVNKKLAESSLDYLIVFNSKNFKNIYMQNLDIENTVQQSRASILFLMHEYAEGRWDNEVEREFGFKIEGDISKFKKLFLRENVDTFVSHLLVKSSQIERKGLSNRITESVKDENGKWRSVSRYLSISEVSWEQSVEDDKRKDVESYLYKLNMLDNEEHTIDSYRADNIYTYINNHKNILTEKQLVFLDYCLNSSETTAFEHIFKEDDSCMSKQLKASYKKNITTRIERELLSKDKKHIKSNGSYYTLIKTDNEGFIKKLLSQKTNLDKFKLIAKEMRKSTERAKDILEVTLDTNTLSYFNDYIQCSEKIEKIETYRFLSNTKFNDFINTLIERLDSGFYERTN